MNIHQSYHRGLPDSKFCHVKKTQNDLQIDRIEFFLDKQRELLVLFLESNLPLELEVKTFINGNNLIIEAPLSLDYNKPFRTHLIEKEILSDYERGSLNIGFSEIQLNQSFSYNILSSIVVNPRLLKVVLNYQPIKNNMKNLIN